MFGFLNGQGDFVLKNPESNSFLYFPLANEYGMMSCISPLLNGDIKSGQNTFALMPVSVMDLQNVKSSRNFWIFVEGKGAWSLTGQSSRQQANIFSENKEETSVKAGFLWHTLCRKSEEMGVYCEALTFVPADKNKVELTKFTIKNISDIPVAFTPTAVVPVYGRSADNLRDHRHVTSLLHRISVNQNGVIVKPALSFDERGHKINEASYGVFAAKGDGTLPTGFFPIAEDFIGEGGSFENPYAVAANAPPYANLGDEFEGYEACGAIRFDETTILPGETVEFIVSIQITEQNEEFSYEYLSSQAFDKHLEINKEYWLSKLSLIFNTHDKQFDEWMKWVSFQPVLRRIYGCSFLPSHDYGRGGRGWRDLWQDCLALLLTEPSGVRDLLLNNFAGVRFDGTNATIIGANPGEFIADRNNITRVWMDHGAWPFITAKLYIDQSGDIEFLLEKQVYFKDKQIYRGKKTDSSWESESNNENNNLKTTDDNIYYGSILEHLLVQHLTSFFNVGEHNNMKLDGADWNDAFDMASQRGESVAFTALYCGNMKELAELLLELKKRKNISDIAIAEEMLILLDSESNSDYCSVDYKLNRLDMYYGMCRHKISGKTVSYPIDNLVNDLIAKHEWLKNHIAKNEFIKNEDGFEWFNGYYDNNSERVEGDFSGGVRMTLTGQVFNIIGNVANDEQVEKVIKAADKYLYDESIGGYRLNTNFHELKTDLGRCFGFAYGHKENGAVFSHMAVMYANALYKRGFAEAGYKALNSLYEHSCLFEKARIYPGLPEYMNSKGRGMYPYLTGSASWYILTMLTEVFGIKGRLGNLCIEPKLLKSRFDNSTASVGTVFAGKPIKFVYENKNNKEYGEYQISEIIVNGQPYGFNISGKSAIIERSFFDSLPAHNDGKENLITIILS